MKATVQATALAAFGLTWLAGAVGASRLLAMPAVGAALYGAAVAGLHWTALLVHHLGHAAAARRTGYPMVGVRLWWWLATSTYPRSEPPLPPRTHIQRAVGGPVASFGLAVLAGLVACLLRTLGGPGWILPAFVGLDSLMVFGVGSLVPLGFNDGSTLIRWWKTAKQSPGR